jgi:hypothetical protein
MITDNKLESALCVINKGCGDFDCHFNGASNIKIIIREAMLLIEKKIICGGHL